MSVKDKFRIGEGMLIMAFAFALQKYHLAAVLSAGAAMLTAVSCQKEGSILRQFPLILAASVIQLTVARMTSLTEVMPETGILVLCNTASAFLFMTCDRRELQSTVKVLTAAGLLFWLLAMVIPSSLVNYADTAVLLGLIFLPVQVCRSYEKQYLPRHARKLMEERQ